MDWLKSCLALIGLASLLFVGSCVLGFAGLGNILDPQSASVRIERPAAEAKRAVENYLDGATSGSFASRARVDSMSDGSVRLLIGRAPPYDMTMSVEFVSDGATATKVAANYNADRLAWSQPEKVLSTNLHRCLRDDFERFLRTVHNGRDGGRLDLDDLIARSRRGDSDLRCDLSTPAPTVTFGSGSRSG